MIRLVALLTGSLMSSGAFLAVGVAVERAARAEGAAPVPAKAAPASKPKAAPRSAPSAAAPNRAAPISPVADTLMQRPRQHQIIQILTPDLTAPSAAIHMQSERPVELLKPVFAQRAGEPDKATANPPLAVRPPSAPPHLPLAPTAAEARRQREEQRRAAEQEAAAARNAGMATGLDRGWPTQVGDTAGPGGPAGSTGRDRKATLLDSVGPQQGVIRRVP